MSVFAETKTNEEKELYEDIWIMKKGNLKSEIKGKI